MPARRVASLVTRSVTMSAPSCRRAAGQHRAKGGGGGAVQRRTAPGAVGRPRWRHELCGCGTPCPDSSMPKILTRSWRSDPDMVSAVYMCSQKGVLHQVAPSCRILGCAESKAYQKRILCCVQATSWQNGRWQAQMPLQRKPAPVRMAASLAAVHSRTRSRRSRPRIWLRLGHRSPSQSKQQ